ncbi:MraY family glycosyltransferase [Clostridium sp. L74]|uniref:MraY family glycosyltransferase n=1 Tax=Clostridium sp. L74 TaxID=1560217 RepID=UPI0006ABB40F|nr:MraY family glycosyltransferase [Clostridium sp. L74]KOR25423.1 glycosyl transferase [Clostridium sp. L74]
MDTKLYIIGAITAIVLSIVLTPIVKKVAFVLGVVDIPKDERKIHKKPIPLLGGIAIYISFIVSLVLKKGPLTLEEVGIILGATVIVIGGFIDDKYDLSPIKKIIFQLVAAICLIVFGLKIQFITNPFDQSTLYVALHVFAIPITILWVIGITNALNLIDGLDGLAAGVALISCVTMFVIAVLNQRWEAAILTSILSGSILGFLPYNFNPASIFMGDTGSQLLGYLLAAISIEGAIKSATAFAIVVPILALGLPIYDTLFAMIRRKINGKPIMQADRGHLHHRLLDMGLTQRQAVVIMYLISAVLGSFAIIAMQISNQKSYFLLATIMLALILIAWKCGFFKHKE